MDARLATWGEVRLGSYINDKTGNVWRVLDERQGWVKLVNPAGQEKPLLKPADTARVTILEPNVNEASRLVQMHLGAVEIATTVIGEKGLRVHDFPTDRASGSLYQARTHLEIIHRVYLEPAITRSIRQMIEMHDEMHAIEGLNHGAWKHLHPRDGDNPSYASGRIAND